MFIPKNNLLVKDVMLSNDNFPIVSVNHITKEAIDKMNHFRIDLAAIVSNKMIQDAIFCDWDLRRRVINNQQTLACFFINNIINYAVKVYKFINEKITFLDAFRLMVKLEIWDLPVINSKLELKGLLHLHPAIIRLLNQRKI